MFGREWGSQLHPSLLSPSLQMVRPLLIPIETVKIRWKPGSGICDGKPRITGLVPQANSSNA